MIHTPSLVIGAGISAVVLIAVFAIFDNSFFEEKELSLEPAPAVQQTGPPDITMSTFYENSSPFLGDPNAPITLVEFGDYQCHFCNVFFHNTEEDIFENYIQTGKVKMLFKDFTIIGPDTMILCTTTGLEKITVGHHLIIC